MAQASVVKTVDIAKERDPVINQIISEMENKKPSHKRLFQQLPKHLRRRAMSYNIKKIPASMRGQVEDQVNAASEAKSTKKPKNRDGSKYRPNSEHQITHRNTHSKWLETHKWHAKRFHISDHWGWKVPDAPTQKGTRAIIRLTSSSCTIRDSSYLSIVSISGNINEIAAHISQNLSIKVNLSPIIGKTQDLEFLSEDKKSIGPSTIIWINENLVWIIIHPLIAASTESLFSSSFNTTLITGEYNIFELYGPESTNLIRKAIHPIAQSNPGLISTLSSLPSPGMIPPGTIFSFEAYDPRTITDNQSFPESNQQPIDYFSENPFVSSTLFTERRYSIPKQADFNKERSKLLFPSAEGPKGSMPVAMISVYSTEKGGFGSGWKLITPIGTGAVTFKKLVHLGARTYGLECSRLIDLEAGKFSFPFDRPDTIEGFNEFTKEIQENQVINNKKPVGKRLDLSMFMFPKNFKVSSSLEEGSFLRISIKMVKRGTPSRFSTIYFPESSDYLIYDKIAEITGVRNSIGLVMKGNSSLLGGEGRGLGFISTLSFVQSLSDSEKGSGFNPKYRPKGAKLVLIKEIGSIFYHPAWVTIHSSCFGI